MTRPLALTCGVLALAVVATLGRPDRAPGQAPGRDSGGPAPDPGRNQAAGADLSRADLVDVMLLGAEPLWVRDRAVDAVLNRRKEVIATLISVIDPANAVVEPENAARFNERQRCAAAYLLGELRAEEAVPVLSRALVNEPCRHDSLRRDRYESPVYGALVKIGRPAVPAMIEHIETTDDRMLRQESMGVVMSVVGTKRHLLELLDKLKGRATDPAKATRIQAARDWAEEHFKEPGGEPLY